MVLRILHSFLNRNIIVDYCYHWFMGYLISGLKYLTLKRYNITIYFKYKNRIKTHNSEFHVVDHQVSLYSTLWINNIKISLDFSSCFITISFYIWNIYIYIYIYRERERERETETYLIIWFRFWGAIHVVCQAGIGWRSSSLSRSTTGWNSEFSFRQVAISSLKTFVYPIIYP